MTDLVGPEMIEPILTTGASARVAADVAPQFSVGDTVVARNLNPHSHTRLPRYVRGKRGTVERDHGVFLFPDTHAIGEGGKPQHVYSVRFDSVELWGPDGTEGDALFIDMWDDYLEPA